MPGLLPRALNHPGLAGPPLGLDRVTANGGMKLPAVELDHIVNHDVPASGPGMASGRSGGRAADHGGQHR